MSVLRRRLPPHQPAGIDRLIHRNTALPARLPRPGRALRASCVIPEPRLPKLHSCLPTDPDSIRLPSSGSVLTAPLGKLYSAVVPNKGAFSIRDQPQPPNPLGSTVGSNWRGAQARWLNVHGQLSFVLTGTAPLGLMYSAVVPNVPKIRVFFPSETNFNLRALWSPPLVPTGAVLKVAGSKPIIKLMPLVRLRFCQNGPPLRSSDVSPCVHPRRDLPSCHTPLLDKMVSAGSP